MAQAVRRRPLTAVAQVRSQVSPCDIGGGRKWHSDRVFFENFFLADYNSTNAPFSSSPSSLLVLQHTYAYCDLIHCCLFWCQLPEFGGTIRPKHVRGGVQ